MKIIIAAVLLKVFSAVGLAQTYLGTYEQVLPPHVFEKNPEMMKAWEMSKQRIKITTKHVTFLRGAALHYADEDSDITYTEHGQFLLAEDKRYEKDVLFTPIYIFDKNTIFCGDFKFVRVDEAAKK